VRSLVLGGCGFIGSHITDALLACGHQVRIFSRTSEQLRTPLSGVEYHIGDFADRAAVNAALRDVDVVIHAISTCVPGTSNMDMDADIHGNLIATVQLLELMRGHEIRRIIYLSSGGTAYGNPEICPVSEDAPIQPICSYGVVKTAIENYLGMYRHIHGFEPVILRLSNPYGPRQRHLGVQGVITSFLHQVRKKEALIVWGDGSNVRDYIHVEEVAQLCVKAILSSISGVFNVGSGVGYSLAEIIAIIASVTNEKSEVHYLECRSFDVKSIVLDISKARDTFDWSPRIKLHQGIRNYWSWMMEYKS